VSWGPKSDARAAGGEGGGVDVVQVQGQGLELPEGRG
jgi:hypothetical protein